MNSTSPAPGGSHPPPHPSVLPFPPPEQRPWGWFETVAEGPDYRVKRLCIAAGQRISRQRHHHRQEHWVVVAGDGVLEIDGHLQPASPGTSVFVAATAIHRATAGSLDLTIIEVQRGSLLSEDDIERFEDDYGRA